MSNDAVADLGDRYFAALTGKQFDDAAKFCSADLTVWNNFTGKTQTLAENLRMLQWVAKRLDCYRYEDVARHLTENGFVQQHVLCGKVGDVEVRAPACMVVHVADGKITQIYEYLNSADLGPLNG